MQTLLMEPHSWIDYATLILLVIAGGLVGFQIGVAFYWWATDRIDFVALEKQRLMWSIKTFIHATPVSSLRKCEEEIKEIEADIESGSPNPEEYADALMCLMDSAGRCGIVSEQIIKAYSEKVKINEDRKWKRNEDNSYSHIKTQSDGKL